MREERSVRFALVLLIVVLFGTLVVLAINLVPSLADLASDSQTATGTAVRQEATSSVPLSEAQGRAELRAHEWSEDAFLVRVEANWYVNDTWREAMMPPLAWSFLYYAPHDGMLTTAVVDDERVLWMNPAAIPVEPGRLIEFPPSYGPELAWVSFLGAGGGAFVAEYPAAQVVFRLQQMGERPIWTLSGFADEAHIQVSLDAETGVVLSSG